MSYDYDRRLASALDTAAQAARKRNDDLGKLWQVLDRLDKRGVNFDMKDSATLKKAADKILSLGEASAKAAQRTLTFKEQNEQSELVSELITNRLREWNSAQTDQLLALRKSPGGLRSYMVRSTAAAAAQLNIHVIDFANAIEHNDPDMLSVEQEEGRKFP